MTLVEDNTPSASSPIQYRRVLTCRGPSSEASPDAMRNCSDLFRQRGQSSGFRKSNGSGAFSCTVAIFLPPCSVIGYCEPNATQHNYRLQTQWLSTATTLDYLPRMPIRSHHISDQFKGEFRRNLLGQKSLLVNPFSLCFQLSQPLLYRFMCLLDFHKSMWRSG